MENRMKRANPNIRRTIDPLLITIIGTAVGLAAVVIGIVIYWGSGPVLAAVPWYISLISAFIALTTLSVAFLALGRYPVLRDPLSFWAGMGFAAYGIGQIFYAITWPGILPGGGSILGGLPNTPAVIAMVDLTILDIFLLSAVTVPWPRKYTLLGLRWLWLVAVWIVFTIGLFSLLILFERNLPAFVDAQGRFTAPLRSWTTIQLFFYGAGSILSVRYYRRHDDRFAGYIAFPQMALIFVHMMVLIGGKRYDLWWYTQRVILASGYLIVLFGLLSEYARLLRRENEGRMMLEAILANVPIGLTITGGPPDFRLKRVSRYGLNMNKRPAEELLDLPAGHHQTAWNIFLPDGVTRPKSEQMPLYRASRYGEDIQNLELMMEGPQGQRIPVLVNAAPIRNSQGQIVAAINTWLDISERKRTEVLLIKQNEALRASEAVFHQLAEAMPQLVWTAKPDGTVDYFNNRIQEYEGISPILENKMQWSAVLHPDDIEITELAWKHSLATGEPFQFEHRLRNTQGEYCWHLSRAILGQDKNGQATKWFGTATNIQDLKLAEDALQQYTTDLERSNRDLQEFAFVASHDLQEPLRKVEAFGDLLLESSENLNEQQHDLVVRMRKSANRMRSMVDGLLQLSRLETQAQPFQPVDLKQIVREVLADLELHIRQSDGTVEVCDLPVIDADPLQMRRLFQNLVGNSLKFQPPGGKARIKVCTEPSTTGSVQILVVDNGIGFDENRAGHLFEPFKRLVGRSEYEGSGMGLAICRRIVERHSGKITVHSQPGQGTSFVVTLPVHQHKYKNSIKRVQENGSRTHISHR